MATTVARIFAVVAIEIPNPLSPPAQLGYSPLQSLHWSTEPPCMTSEQCRTPAYATLANVHDVV
jgi:hypothetical protein